MTVTGIVTKEQVREMLMRYRREAGLSLAALAAQLHYSKGYLSRVERGERGLSAVFIHSADRALGAGGKLVELYQATETGGTVAVRRGGSAVRSRAARADTPPASLPPGAEADVAAYYADSLVRMRALGRRQPALTVLHMVDGMLRPLIRLAEAAGEPRNRTLLVLASRYAEFAGWMAQESGHRQRALALTNQAVDLAAAGGDATMSGYALVRKALFHLYDKDSAATTALAEQAGRLPGLPPRVRGLAAQRHAQGLALACDRAGFERQVARARQLIWQAAADEPATAVGTSLRDPVGLAAGWSLLDLGDAAACAAVLEREIPRIPSDSRRTRARYVLRCALAHAMVAELPRAYELARTVLPDIAAVGSATVQPDLTSLQDALRRWPRDPRVRSLLPEIRLVAGRFHGSR